MFLIAVFKCVRLRYQEWYGTIPKELRTRVVAAVEQGDLPIVEIATLFGVGMTFVKKMLPTASCRGRPGPAARWGSRPEAARQRPGAAACRDREAARCDAGRIANGAGRAQE